MVGLAIANGILRESTYGKWMPELCAHQLSTLTGIILMGAYIWTIGWWWNPLSSREALLIGAVWVGLTVTFEFGFGLLVMGHPLSRLLNDYNLFAGRVWLLFLLWLGVAPWIFFRLRTRTRT